MKSPLLSKSFRYVGVGAALLVPAFVVAQQQRNPPADGTFAPQTLLLASDVEQLRDALADALIRINQLEANAGPPITKNADVMYTQIVESPLTAQNATATATAGCANDNDVFCSTALAKGDSTESIHRRWS